MALKYSTYYRIDNRDKYFEKFFAKERKKMTDDAAELAEEMYKDTLEIITSYILTSNELGLTVLLTKANNKIAKKFFDYLTCSDTIHCGRVETIKIIERVLNGVNYGNNS